MTLLVDGERFQAHRVVLAAHSQYFLTMFTCGMTETREEAVTIHGLTSGVFRIVLTYIYRGRVDTSDVDSLKGTFLAANMLQMTDLEHITVNKLHKLCNLANCIDMYFFVSTYCHIESHPGKV